MSGCVLCIAPDRDAAESKRSVPVGSRFSRPRSNDPTSPGLGRVRPGGRSAGSSSGSLLRRSQGVRFRAPLRATSGREALAVVDGEPALGADADDDARGGFAVGGLHVLFAELLAQVAV